MHEHLPEKGVPYAGHEGDQGQTLMHLQVMHVTREKAPPDSILSHMSVCWHQVETPQARLRHLRPG